MKGTVFAVALNHRSQTEAWHDAFLQPPYKTPPQTPVWFIKPRNTVIRSGDAIPFPQGEEVCSGATIALVIGKTARKVSASDAANYIAGYALANDVSLPEPSFYRPAIKANVDSVEIVTEINGQEANRWSTADLNRSAAELLCALSDFATLQPGDVILLGTPQQRVSIKPGDNIIIKAAGLPTLENSVRLQPKRTGETA